MIFIIKDLDRDKKYVIKIYYSNKPWEKFEKILNQYSRSFVLLYKIDGGRALKKKIISKLSNFKIEDDWFIYNENIIKEINNVIKNPTTLKKSEIISLLNSPGKKNKKLKILCDYILANGDKSLQTIPNYLKNFKKIIDTLGIDKISSLNYRYNNCLNQIV